MPYVSPTAVDHGANFRISSFPSGLNLPGWSFQLFQVLKDAHKDFLIDVEMRAECDPSFTKGSLTAEVILLTKVTYVEL